MDSQSYAVTLLVQILCLLLAPVLMGIVYFAIQSARNIRK